MTTYEGMLVAQNLKIAVVVTRWNSFIADHLLEGALDAIVRHGGDEEDIEVFKVPGAFEIPLMVKKIAQTGRFDAVVALGVVIRGGTPHFDYVAGEATKGIAQVMLETGVPISFGILTVDSIEQAIERAGTKAGNKGEEAALTAIEMVQVLASMDDE